MATGDGPRGGSKSARKRERLALQALAKRIVEAPERRVERLPLGEALRAAVAEARSMPHAARRRQLRFIAGLLAREDSAAVERALAGQDRPHADDVRAFHEVERWRDALIGGDDGPMQRVLERFPMADRRHLQALVARARAGASGDPRPARLLFRYLMALRSGRT